MATLTVNDITETANVRDTDSDVFVAAASAGDEFVNQPGTWVELLNVHGGASRTITFTSQKTTVAVDGFGQSISTGNVTAVLNKTANEESAIIALPPVRFNDGNGKVQVTYSDSAADIKIAVFRLAVNK